MSTAIKNSIVKVGGGRGFIVEHGRYKYFITAAHCLPELPRRIGLLISKKRPTLVGPIGADQSITVECLFVDPVSDISQSLVSRTVKNYTTNVNNTWNSSSRLRQSQFVKPPREK